MNNERAFALRAAALPASRDKGFPLWGKLSPKVTDEGGNKSNLIYNLFRDLGLALISRGCALTPSPRQRRSAELVRYAHWGEGFCSAIKFATKASPSGGSSACRKTSYCPRSGLLKSVFLPQLCRGKKHFYPHKCANCRQSRQ